MAAEFSAAFEHAMRIGQITAPAKLDRNMFAVGKHTAKLGGRGKHQAAIHHSLGDLWRLHKNHLPRRLDQFMPRRIGEGKIVQPLFDSRWRDRGRNRRRNRGRSHGDASPVSNYPKDVAGGNEKTPAQTTIRKNSGKSIISLKKSRQLP
jgi:hypothetical protein